MRLTTDFTVVDRYMDNPMCGFLISTGLINVTHKLFEGKHHELRNADILDEAYDDCLRYINSICCE